MKRNGASQRSPDRLVAFACDKNDVGRRRCGDGPRIAVARSSSTSTATRPGIQSTISAAIRPDLPTVVVARYPCMVRAVFRRTRHQRALAAVAVTAAAEHADHRDRRHGAADRKHLRKRIGRMCEIDHDQRLPEHSDELHAPGRRRQLRTRIDDLVEGAPARHAARSRRGEIRHVEFTEQRHTKRASTPWRRQFSVDAGFVKTRSDHADPRQTCCRTAADRSTALLSR